MMNRAISLFNNGDNEHPKRCYCGFTVSIQKTWTKENPGRRFIACPDYDVETNRRGCIFFRWIDEQEPTTWQTIVILGLMQDKQSLAAEVDSFRTKLSEANNYARKREADYVMSKMRRPISVKCEVWVVILVVLFFFYLVYFKLSGLSG
ncbi:uncharacterized protein [Spinacia oleracea]|uniref:GRF-type domain-containing protein n=1 Tax=Spinacia oleracea TaxID=3562 RepID=A0ABM3QZR3_SPIOL|nr:uncharacterized protein LOC130463685 [Spinacia oleracea]